MIYRIAAATIVLFWFIMTSLLIRLEVSPESDLLALPVNHVLQLMLSGGQSSELTILQNDARVGSLVLRPKAAAEADHRAFDFSGNLIFGFPLMNHQRFLWEGDVDMDRADRLTRLNLNVTLHDPPRRVRFLMEPPKALAHYDVRTGNRVIADGSIPLDEKGLDSLLREMGIDTSVFAGLQNGLGAPAVTARRSKLTVRKETLETYLITVRQGETTYAEIYVSQLGQILLARTSLGYTFSAEDITP